MGLWHVFYEDRQMECCGTPFSVGVAVTLEVPGHGARPARLIRRPPEPTRRPPPPDPRDCPRTHQRQWIPCAIASSAPPRYSVPTAPRSRSAARGCVRC
ncbi:DUF6578 domain-containing protein [Streptomyces sp. NPDC021056]|uniref:DUF6578 domain-containing protein n=1 Tax=Streptomyces sp. NPDC021056 TaxID=3155012 RepID=UPI00340AF24B